MSFQNIALNPQGTFEKEDVLASYTQITRKGVIKNVQKGK